MRVLFTPITSSSIAHIARCLAVADRLKQLGHEVFFTSDVSKKSFIESQGYSVVKDYPTVNLNDPNEQSVNFFKSRRDDIIRWFAAEIAATKEVRPDVVVAASGIFGPHTYFATGIPVVSIVDSQYLDESKGLMGLSMSTDKFSHRLLVNLLKPLFAHKFVKLYLAEILSIYRDLGIPLDVTSRAELYKPMSVIIPSDEVLEPLSQKRHHTAHVGPLFWDGFEKMETDLTDEFLIQFKGDKPLIYTMFGGSIFDKKIYDQVIPPLVNMHANVIVCFGPNWDREDFPVDTENFLYRKYVPGMRLSKHADLVIHTGAQGTVSQALYFGKPQIAIPTIMDQAYFANRLEELGAGINVNKISLMNFSKREAFASLPTDVGTRIVAAAKEIMQNRKYSLAAMRYRDILNNYKDPAGRAVELIQEFITT